MARVWNWQFVEESSRIITAKSGSQANPAAVPPSSLICHWPRCRLQCIRHSNVAPPPRTSFDVRGGLSVMSPFRIDLHRKRPIIGSCADALFLDLVIAYKLCLNNTVRRRALMPDRSEVEAVPREFVPVDFADAFIRVHPRHPCSNWMRSRLAGRGCESGDFCRRVLSDESWIFEPVGGANGDEPVSSVSIAVSEAAHPRRSPFSFGQTERYVSSDAQIELEMWEGPLGKRERLSEGTPRALREALSRLDGNRTDSVWIEIEDVG